MTVEDRHGIVLDFSEPTNNYERIVVRRVRPGKSPERIGTIQRMFDKKTDMVTYRAINDNHDPIGPITTDWQKMEEFYQQYAHQLSHNQVHQTFLRIMGRTAELKTIREKRQAIGRELNR